MSNIKHESYTTLFQDPGSDPLGLNEDPGKAERIAKYCTPWRTTDGPPISVQLKATIIDHLADPTPGGIVVWVTGANGIPEMKAIVGLKKYTSDPSCMSSTLMGHYYGILGDVEDGGGEIIKFDFDVLALSPPDQCLQGEASQEDARR